MSWWKYAKPGDKVVCIRGKLTPLFSTNRSLSSDAPIQGQVYTIRRIEPIPAKYSYTCCALVLVGFHERLGVVAHAFRPVQPKSTETGMAVLRRLLTDKKARVKT
jgi:hypothetical protein